jgi:hypothetical protein
MEDITATEISQEQMLAGIVLAHYYGTEALRLFEVGQISADLFLARRLLNWLHNNWTGEFVSPPDIQQRGPRGIRVKADADRLITILANHNWLIRMGEPMTINGTRRNEVYRIVKG